MRAFRFGGYSHQEGPQGRNLEKVSTMLDWLRIRSLTGFGVILEGLQPILDYHSEISLDDTYEFIAHLTAVYGASSKDAKKKLMEKITFYKDKPQKLYDMVMELTVG